MSSVKLRLDLRTPEGAAAMRAYLDKVQPYGIGGDAQAAYQRGFQQGRLSVLAEAAAEPPDRAQDCPPDEGEIDPLIEGPWERVDSSEAPSFIVEQSAGEGPQASPPAEDVPPGLAIIAARHATIIAEHLQAQPDPAPATSVDWPPEDAAAVAPPASEPPGEPEPAPLAPIDMLDVAPAPSPAEGGGDDLDPERPWTDALKLQVWDMAEDGHTVAQIGKALSFKNQRLHNFLWMVRNGKARLPERPAPSTTAVAVVPKETRALADIGEGSREIARDPAIVADWQEKLATAEREKAVTRAYSF